MRHTLSAPLHGTIPPLFTGCTFPAASPPPGRLSVCHDLPRKLPRTCRIRLPRPFVRYGRYRRIRFCHIPDRADQLCYPIARPRRTQYHRTAQFRRQCRTVHENAAPRRLVHEIHTDHHPPRDGQHLTAEHQIPLQCPAVTDNRHHRSIRQSVCQAVACHLLLRGMRREGIRPRQIDNAERVPAVAQSSLLFLHRLPAPVSRVLLQPRQPIENRAFAHIGISRKDHRDLQILPPPRLFALIPPRPPQRPVSAARSPFP